MDIIIQLVGAYLVTVTAGITLSAPRHLVFKAGIIGVISYGIYIALTQSGNLNDVINTFIACFVASLISQYFARRYKSPVTIFYIPTFYLYVPGSSIYQMAYHFIDENINMASYFLIQTISIALAIALGVFLSDSFLEIYIDIKNKIQKKIEVES